MSGYENESEANSEMSTGELTIYLTSFPAYKLVLTTIFMQRVSNQVECLNICSDCCNNIIELNLNDLRSIQSISIGDNSFRLIKTFRIEGLQELQYLTIGNNSFTYVKPEHWRIPFSNQAFQQKLYNRNKSFHIINCKKLTKIEIGTFSFSDYAGQFELKHLPSLKNIKIGSFGDENNLSFNFLFCRFELKGSLVLFHTQLDLYSLESLCLGSGAFGRPITTLLESTSFILKSDCVDLPSLITIDLGLYGLYGDWEDFSCTLVMKG